ncbi:MAG: GNAT family N-acetyltransferase [Actinomycetota bacterium]
MAIIRNATEDDFELLKVLDEEFAGTGVPLWSLVNEDAMRTKISSKMLLLAEDDHKLIGYLMWTLFWGRPFIEFIRLLPEHRNKRIGTEMLEVLVKDVSERGYTMLWSSTENPNALRWHERNGFKPVGETEWTWNYPNEIWLTRELQPRT